MPAVLIAADSAEALRREALRLASALLCTGHDDARRCPTCRRVAERSHPDFLRVAPDGLQIKVDSVREAIRFAVGRPYEAPARVVWIESAEALREGAAANALLKSLEEPGDFVTWILTTTAPEAILATIRSRCQRQRLPRRAVSQWRAELASRGLDAAAIDDAIAFEFEPEAEFDLGAAREARRGALSALVAGETSSLLALAASAADEESEVPLPGLVAGLLRDAAVLASGGSLDRLRHRAVATELAAIAKLYPAEALRRGAVEADGLPEKFSRFVPKRLAWEQALLELVGGAGK